MFLEYYYPCLTKWSLHGVQKPVEVSEPGAPVLLRLNESLTHTHTLSSKVYRLAFVYRTPLDRRLYREYPTSFSV